MAEVVKAKEPEIYVYVGSIKFGDITYRFRQQIVTVGIISMPNPTLVIRHVDINLY